MNYKEDNYLDDIDNEEIEGDENEVANQYLIIKVYDTKYAMPILNLKEISLLPDIRPYPDMKKYEKGLFKLRDETVYVVDLRQRLGYKTLEEEEAEIINSLNSAEESHHNWLNELLISIKENKEFKQSTDAHQCQFGKWYYSFRTSSISLQTYLSQFELPHNNFHKIAEKAIKAKEEEGLLKAIEIINNAKNNELKYLTELFSKSEIEVKESKREIVVILNINDSLMGFTADYVDSIITIDDDKIDFPKENLEKSKFMKGTFKANNEVFVILDPEKLY